MKIKRPRIIINDHPFSSPVEVVGDIALALGPGCTNSQVELVVNPNIHHYEEMADVAAVKIRQHMVVRTDENTQFLTFLFDSPKNTAEVIVDDVRIA